MAGKSKNPNPTLTVGALAKVVARLFPPHLAEDWDNVGLQIGNPDSAVRGVLTCLEVTQSTLAEAVRTGSNAVVAHHPLIFRPLKNILTSAPASRLVTELIRADINLIVAHTNLDCAPWGTNQVLAGACGLEVTGPLRAAPLDPAAESRDLKMIVFTPAGHEDAMIEAIHRGGGGRIGLYSRCTFRSPGTGTFLGGEGSDPFLGEAGRLESAEEFRLEAVVPRAVRDEVLAEVRKAHPYEEPAVDFIPLAGDPGVAGAGCMARPAGPMTARELAADIKRRMGLSYVRLSGPPDRKVRKVAICTGSGGSFLGTAASRGADAYLTGEITYHYGIEAHQRSLPVIEIGHFESEVIVAGPLAEKLLGTPEIRSAGVTVTPAADDLQPFVMI